MARQNILPLIFGVILFGGFFGLIYSLNASGLLAVTMPSTQFCSLVQGWKDAGNYQAINQECDQVAYEINYYTIYGADVSVMNQLKEQKACCEAALTPNVIVVVNNTNPTLGQMIQCCNGNMVNDVSQCPSSCPTPPITIETTKKIPDVAYASIALIFVGAIGLVATARRR